MTFELVALKSITANLSAFSATTCSPISPRGLARGGNPGNGSVFTRGSWRLASSGLGAGSIS
jgi:hypothetical protein